MSIYNKLVISGYKLIGKFSKFDPWKKFETLLENQFKSFEEIEKLQWIKLKKILGHAYENVQFYRDK